MGREILNNIQSCFVSPPNCKIVNPGRHIQYIVMHTIEDAETSGGAMATAEYFKGGGDGRHVSAHYCVSDKDIVQCVQTKDIANAAPGANRNGIHIEMVGRAEQTAVQWQDAFSLETMKNAAWLIGQVLVPKFLVPVEFITADQIRAGVDNTLIRGITTHWEVTKSGIRPGNHTDPGPNWPMTQFMSYCRQAVIGTLS